MTVRSTLEATHFLMTPVHFVRSSNSSSFTRVFRVLHRNSGQNVARIKSVLNIGLPVRRVHGRPDLHAGDIGVHDRHFHYHRAVATERHPGREVQRRHGRGHCGETVRTLPREEKRRHLPRVVRHRFYTDHTGTCASCVASF